MSEHGFDHSVSLLPPSLSQMLIDVHSHIDFLVSEPLLDILQRCAVLHQHGSVSMTQTVKIKLRQIQLLMDDVGGVLHRSQRNVLTIFSSANKIHFFFHGLFGDDLVCILEIMSVPIGKINFCSLLPVMLTPQKLSLGYRLKTAWA